jgi:hypothetical protein
LFPYLPLFSVLTDHSVETFFAHAPQLPRMIHRPTILARLKYPPTHALFPHAALLHAICAYAATYTAWVTSLPPEVLEAAIEREKIHNYSLEGIEDFGLAQAEAAQRSMRLTTQCCAMGPGGVMLEMAQASVNAIRACRDYSLTPNQIIISDLYFLKGLPMLGWIQAGIGPRLIKALGVQDKPASTNPPREMGKPPMMQPDPDDAVDREQRLMTVWMAFVQDAGFSTNSSWSQSMSLEEIRCPLPSSAEGWGDPTGFFLNNPQTATSPDLLSE